MAIKTSTFGRVELSGEEATWFIKHLEEDKQNPKAQVTLEHGRDLLRQILSKSTTDQTK